jgi:hypothetical protein
MTTLTLSIPSSLLSSPEESIAMVVEVGFCALQERDEVGMEYALLLKVFEEKTLQANRSKRSLNALDACVSRWNTDSRDAGKWI